jgi:hypothetical protein
MKIKTLPLLITLVLGCIGFLPKAQAVSPVPDGGYPGGNTAEGTDALLNLTSGVWNSGFGFEALNHDTAGGKNTATGIRALFSDTTGSFNTATGVYALYSNTNGWYNSAIGANALSNNITGNYNTANGYGALYHNHSDDNTAIGFGALFHNTTGTQNTATGDQALNLNTDGYYNTASGYQALYSNTGGPANTANGYQALYSNTAGDSNTANGEFALYHNTTGVTNTANGVDALHNNTIGSNNTALGYFAGLLLSTGNHNIDIANSGVAGDDGTIRIGTSGLQTATFIAGIYDTAVSGTTVIVSSSGQLGVAASSQRFKAEIKPMEKASEAVLALKPVTFRYKPEFDPDGIAQFGLVAEEVEKVNPALVLRDADGKPYSVRYEAVNAMLLNEFLKEHRKVEAQEATITQLKQDFQSKLVEQQKQIKALTTGLQKVSAQLAAASPSRGGLEVDKPAPQMVSGSR